MEMHVQSSINTLFTLEYMQNEHENKYFDRKSAGIRLPHLASIISAFANADGGTIVIGINDNGSIEGINFVGEEKIYNLVNALVYRRIFKRY